MKNLHKIQAPFPDYLIAFAYNRQSAGYEWDSINKIIFVASYIDGEYTKGQQEYIKQKGMELLLRYNLNIIPKNLRLKV